MATIPADDIFKCIFMNEKFCTDISIQISLKCVPKGPIYKKSAAMAQVMVWRWSGDKSVFWTYGGLVYWHICVTWTYMCHLVSMS